MQFRKGTKLTARDDGIEGRTLLLKTPFNIRMLRMQRLLQDKSELGFLDRAYQAFVPSAHLRRHRPHARFYLRPKKCGLAKLQFFAMSPRFIIGLAKFPERRFKLSDSTNAGRIESRLCLDYIPRE